MVGGQGVGFGNGGDAEEVVKNRFLRFLLWQSVQSTVIYFLCKTLLLSPFTRNPFTPSFVDCLAFFIFHLSLLLFSTFLFVVASPQRHNPGSPLELVLGLIRLVFVSGGQPPPPKFHQLAKISLTFLLFVTASTLSGFLSLFCLCWNFFDESIGKKYYWRLLRNFGFRGLAIGFSYGLCYLYKRRWVLQFPIIQRPSFFSFKMGLPSATLQALKLSSAAYFFSSVLLLFLPCEFKGQITIGEVVPEQVVFYMTFVIFLCWEVNHHLHQVLHTRRFIFAPAKGSAAAETNPSEPLLAALEESTPRSLIQYLAYLDLCMVCESNVDIWRRAAFFEETGETYKRVMAVCLSPLEQFASKLGEIIESSSVGKSFQVDHQLRLPIDSRLSSSLHDIFDDFQLCSWCSWIVARLTVHSHKEDRFGVAQLSGSNSCVISTLLCCLLAVETFMGKNSKLQCITGSSGIKWATSSTRRREPVAVAVAVGRRGEGSLLYSKAYRVADVLRTSIYCIVSAFHDEMMASAKAGLLDNEWIASRKHVCGTHELLSQKLHVFIEFQAN